VNATTSAPPGPDPPERARERDSPAVLSGRGSDSTAGLYWDSRRTAAVLPAPTRGVGFTCSAQ